MWENIISSIFVDTAAAESNNIDVNESLVNWLKAIQNICAP